MSEDSLQKMSLELVETLREVAEDLSTTEVTAENVAAALELSKRLREQLTGPRRTRWYEGEAKPAPLGDQEQSTYLNHSPIRGLLNPLAPPLHVETVTRDDGSQAILGRARLGSVYEGPPHGVHGGWIAALFDELLGVTQMLEGDVGVTVILEVKYRSITPIGEDLLFTGWVAEKRQSRLIARATCHAGERLTAEAKGVFMKVNFDELRERK